MMTFGQKVRRSDLTEIMDDPNCDREKLFATYRHFRTINRLLSQWSVIYRVHIRPFLKNHTTAQLLDIGSGAGDICIYLANRARKDGFRLSITGADPDARVREYLATNNIRHPDVTFSTATLNDVARSGKRFDFIISNHLMHHVSDSELSAMMMECEKLVTYKVLFNDISRSTIARPLFWILTKPWFQNSFITEDGLISIQRSFTPKELRSICRPDWQVHRIFPFRLIATYTHPSHDTSA